MNLRQQLKRVPLLRKVKKQVDLLNEIRTRNARIVKRSVAITKNPGEYFERRRWAQAVPDAECLDLDSFKRDGFLVYAPPAAELQELIAACNEKAKQPEVVEVRSKKFFTHFLAEQDFNLEGIFVRFALNERLLNTVAKFMGSAPVLTNVDLILSAPNTTSLEYSQFWHRDRTDTEVVKVCVYISDVTMENGPFTLVSRQESLKVPEFHSHYYTDEEFERHVDQSKVQVITGKAGTTLIVDTHRCYHLGSRCQKPRLAFFIAYETAFGWGPRRKWLLGNASVSALSPAQRLALSL